MADRWECTPYVIKSQPNPDIPVYEVKSDNPRARKTRVLHRNLLLPFLCLGLPRGRPVPNAHDVSLHEDDSVPVDTLNQISDPPADESDTYERVVESQTPNTSDTPVSHDSQRPERPKRARKQPAWIKSPDWVLSQAPTYEFWVDPKDIVRL